MYDCQQCGACCVDYFGTEGHIELTPAETGRMRRLGLPAGRVGTAPDWSNVAKAATIRALRKGKALVAQR